MNFGRLLAIGKCVDRMPAGGSPFLSGELEFLLGLETQKSGEAALKSVAGISDDRRASRIKEKSGKFCFPEACRLKTTFGSSPRKRISIQGKQAQRKVFWESPWDVQVSASECLELGPRLFREKRKLGLRRWLREGFRILCGRKRKRKIDDFYEKR